jgi:hypothetical protein
VAEKEKAGDRLFWCLVISLSSEITDTKGRHDRRGWVFFDRDCSVCTSLARRFRRPLETRGFGLAALQDPRVQALLALPAEDLLREMRVATAEAMCTAAQKPSCFLLVKSRGPGRSTPQLSCPAFRPFSTPAIAGLPITGLARRDRVLFQGMEARIMFLETQKEDVNECGHCFPCGVSHNDRSRFCRSTISEKSTPNHFN